MDHKLHGYQYFFIVLLCCLGSLLLIGTLQRELGAASWLGAAAAFGGLVLDVLFICLFRSGGDSSLPEINECAFGKAAGKGITLVYAVFFLLSSAALLKYYAVFACSELIGDTPTALFVTAVAAAVAYCVSKGVSTIGRMAALAGVLMLALTALALSAELAMADVSNILPVRIESAEGLAWAVLPFALLQFGELFAAAALLPQTAAKARSYRFTLTAVCLGNGLIALFALADALALGDTLAMQSAGFYRAIRVTDLGEFVNRVEAFVVAAYFLATVFRVIAELFLVRECVCGTIGIRRRNRSAPVLAALMAGAAIALPEELDELSAIYMGAYTLPAVIVLAVLPLATLAALRLRRRRSKALT